MILVPTLPCSIGETPEPISEYGEMRSQSREAKERKTREEATPLLRKFQEKIPVIFNDLVSVTVPKQPKEA